MFQRWMVFNAQRVLVHGATHEVMREGSDNLPGCLPLRPIHPASGLCSYTRGCVSTHATAPTYPISFATAAQQPARFATLLEHVFSSISVRAPDPSSRPSGPFLSFLPRESTPDPRNRILASTLDPRALGREV